MRWSLSRGLLGVHNAFFIKTAEVKKVVDLSFLCACQVRIREVFLEILLLITQSAADQRYEVHVLVVRLCQRESQVNLIRRI